MFRLLRKLEGASSLAAVALLAAVSAAPALAAGQAPEPASPAAPSAHAAESVEEQVRDLERQVEELRAEIARLRAEREGRSAAETAPRAAPETPPAPPAPRSRIDELERRLDVLAGELERLELGQTQVRADAGQHGYGPAASKVYRTGQGLSVGGYGEVLYQGFDSTRDDGSPTGERDTLDLERAVFYFGYKLTDRWLFNSEVEHEHAAVGEEHDEGEVGVEFAYLDYLWRPAASFRAGLVLVPMGFLNELHEPTVFLGARRPDVEDEIIPTTWRENGFGLFGEAGPFTYRTYVINGFDGSRFEDEGLHEGKQDGAQAVAEDFAWVGRLDYTPVPGVLVGGSAYLGDSGQGLEDSGGRRIGLGTAIYEGHAEWRWRGLELRALGARAELDDVARLDRALGLTGDESVGDRLSGWYLQAGYDLLAGRTSGRQLIPYARWEELDTQASVPAGFARNPANDSRSLTLGLAFKPIDQIVFKADYQDYDNEAGTGLDRINVALGYIF